MKDVRPALAPELREGESPVPHGECSTCEQAEGTYNPDCLDCLATWLRDPEPEPS